MSATALGLLAQFTLTAFAADSIRAPHRDTIDFRVRWTLDAGDVAPAGPLDSIHVYYGLMPERLRVRRVARTRAKAATVRAVTVRMRRPEPHEWVPHVICLHWWADVWVAGARRRNHGELVCYAD